MDLTRKQFEFLKFVQSGDDWNCLYFVEIVQKYYECRKQGVLTNPPFPSRPISKSSNPAIDALNTSWRNTEYTNQDIYRDDGPLTEVEYQHLIFQLQNLTTKEITQLQFFINMAVEGNVFFVKNQENIMLSQLEFEILRNALDSFQDVLNQLEQEGSSSKSLSLIGKSNCLLPLAQKVLLKIPYDQIEYKQPPELPTFLNAA
jgi:hypothetical protein